MANTEKEDLERYLAEANSWDKSRKIQSQNSEKRAWRVAYASMAIAGLAVLGVSMLTPLKTVKTEMFVADKATGTFEPLQSLGVVQVSLDEVFHRKFLRDFLLARENYTAETAENNYYTAAAFMSPKLQEGWGSLWKPENPDNPINVYKSGKVRNEIISISLKRKEDGTQDVATIRFAKKIEGTGTDKDGTRIWVATITYRFVDSPKDQKERLINPAGFQVIDYQTDSELPGGKR